MSHNKTVDNEGEDEAKKQERADRNGHDKFVKWSHIKRETAGRCGSSTIMIVKPLDSVGRRFDNFQLCL